MERRSSEDESERSRKAIDNVPTGRLMDVLREGIQQAKSGLQERKPITSRILFRLNTQTLCQRKVSLTIGMGRCTLIDPSAI